MPKSVPSAATAPDARPSPDLVRSELERLLRSDQFKNSKRCQSLLTYLVEETLADRSDQLKERLVGMHVFGRTPDYDTAEDPVVRNAAIEVRKRLAQFYVECGRNAPVRIYLNAGKYVPEFRSSESASASIEADTALPAPEAELNRAITQPELHIAESEPPPHFSAVELVPAVPHRRRWIAIGVLGCVLLLIIAGAYLIHQFHSSAPAAYGGDTVAVAPSASVGASSSGPALPAEGEIRILAGNEQSGPYTDRFGNQWMPDRYFSGGEVKAGVTSFFFPPADPVFFRNLREGAFRYDIPLQQNEAYELRLYFVEPQYRYGNRVGGDGENIRLFQVRANGQTILDNFDVIKDAGFASTSVRAFKDIKADKDGKLHLEFVPEREQPLVSGIELIPMAEHRIPPIRIHMAPSQYTDHEGRRWSADNFYLGGQLFDSGTAVTDTPDPDLFNVERIGNFAYAIPVPPGRYTLTLYFAETWFRKPGERFFNVTCNGVLLMRDLDLYQQAGRLHVYQKTFRGLEPNGQGKLLISFSPSVNYASVRALEVAEE